LITALLLFTALSAPEWECHLQVELYSGRRSEGCSDPRKPIQCIAQSLHRCRQQDRTIERTFERPTDQCRSSFAECWQEPSESHSKMQLVVKPPPWRFRVMRNLGWQCEAERLGLYFQQSAAVCKQGNKPFACYEDTLERCVEPFQDELAELRYERFTGVCSDRAEDCL